MRVPQLNSANNNTIFTQQFLGYNHNLRTGEGEFYDMKNMSTDNYPVISTRQGEEDKLALAGTPNGLHEYAPDTLMAVTGNVLHIGITEDSAGVILPESAEYLTDSGKSFATIGVYTVIMPDKVVFNSRTNSLDTIEKFYENKTFNTGNLHDNVILELTPSDMEGEIVEYVQSDEAPEDTTKYWWDTVNYVWKKYSTSTELWVTLETMYYAVKPALENNAGNADAESYRDEISNYLAMHSPLDSISLSLTGEDEDVTNLIVYAVGETEGIHYVVITNNGMVAGPTYRWTLKTRCPELEHLVALNNRIWGVSNSTHEIFACKLGNPTQWYNYAGIASDSYAVSLGFADEVTASSAFNNYPHFFTEDKIIKFYGDYPANYQMATTAAEGVVSGGHDTVVTVEGLLFYVSPIGVMSYDGSLPYFRSQKFAPNYLTGKTVVAGKDGTKYCLSVSKDGVSEGVYVFDTLYRLWTKGGDQIYRKTAGIKNALCFLNPQSRLITLFDRERKNDLVANMGDNLFSFEREETIF